MPDPPSLVTVVPHALIDRSLRQQVCCADDGDLLICGSNDNHQLGFNSRELRRSNSLSDGEMSSLYLSQPRRIGALDALTVHHAAMGSAHALAVVADGALAVWGTSEFGQLGDSPAPLAMPVGLETQILGKKHMEGSRQ